VTVIPVGPCWRSSSRSTAVNNEAFPVKEAIHEDRVFSQKNRWCVQSAPAASTPACSGRVPTHSSARSRTARSSVIGFARRHLIFPRFLGRSLFLGDGLIFYKKEANSWTARLENLWVSEVFFFSDADFDQRISA
jgi:hypothetical protein